MLGLMAKGDVGQRRCLLAEDTGVERVCGERYSAAVGQTRVGGAALTGCRAPCAEGLLAGDLVPAHTLGMAALAFHCDGKRGSHMPCQCASFQGRWVGGGLSMILAMWLVLVVRLSEGWCCKHGGVVKG
jgi:hypothetical protein